MPDHADAGTVAIPLIEEVATVDKQAVVTGRVTVRTMTELHEEIVQEELADENVEVTRIPIDRVVETMPQLRTEGEVTIVPVFEERLAVTKQLVLVEEVHIRRRRSVEQVEVPVTLRRQIADITQG